ncbi:DUF305 domain-containing protein [Actinopolymorpha singaporensis]
MGAARNVVHKGAYSAVAVAALIGIATLLAGCGGGNGTPAQPADVTVPAGKHNAQDVEFTEEMVEHNLEVVAMSRLAAKKATNAQVKSLAAKIKAAHAPKVAELSAWLKAWGEPVPTMDPTPHMTPHMSPHMTHSPSPGTPTASHSPGMMDEHELSDLRHASGKQFDKMYVEAMIHQYSEAVDEAKIEQAKGLYPPAKKLAAEIVTNYPAEIVKMQALLKKL